MLNLVDEMKGRKGIEALVSVFNILLSCQKIGYSIQSLDEFTQFHADFIIGLISDPQSIDSDLSEKISEFHAVYNLNDRGVDLIETLLFKAAKQVETPINVIKPFYTRVLMARPYLLGYKVQYKNLGSDSPIIIVDSALIDIPDKLYEAIGGQFTISLLINRCKNDGSHLEFIKYYWGKTVQRHFKCKNSFLVWI